MTRLLLRDLDDSLHHRLRRVFGGAAGQLYPNAIGQAPLVPQNRSQIVCQLHEKRMHSYRKTRYIAWHTVHRLVFVLKKMPL